MCGPLMAAGIGEGLDLQESPAAQWYRAIRSRQGMASEIMDGLAIPFFAKSWFFESSLLVSQGRTI